jgi:hypothetical protein
MAGLLALCKMVLFLHRLMVMSILIFQRELRITRLCIGGDLSAESQMIL